jgi:integrase
VSGELPPGTSGLFILRGEIMAIRKRGKGWQIDYFDPTGKRVRKSFKKKKDAAAELAKRVSLIAEGRYLDVRKDYRTTIDELVAQYDKNFQDQPHYMNAKKTYLERFRDHFGADTIVAHIHYRHIETYCKDVKRRLTPSNTIRSASACNREVAALHHLFVKGVEWDMLEKSPFDRGKSMLVKENNRRTRYLKKAEMERLVAECPAYLADIVVCALNSGMRKGEVLSLKWGQIRDGFIYLTRTKTDESRQSLD